MKTLTLSLSIFLFTFLGSSQTIEKFSIDNGGASVNVGSINILYTIGEVNVHELSLKTIQLSEGFINSNPNINNSVRIENGFLNTNTEIENFTSIKQNVADMEIKLFPNPASTVVQISSKNEIYKIELFNIFGEQVQTAIKTNEINIESLKAGIYVVKIESSRGELIKKIIKN